MPAVPGTVSRMIAAMFCAPSSRTMSLRCCSARSVSSASDVEPKCDRYVYAGMKCTTPSPGVSLGKRRGSPVTLTARFVPP